MFTIQFPEFDFKVKYDGNKRLIFDSIRKKYVAITPEEWVRQHIIRYLIEVKKYPKQFIAVEYSIVLNQQQKRCDIVVFNKNFQPKIIIECKQPEVSLSQAVADQAGRYNMVLQVPYLAISNGVENIVAKIDFNIRKSEFLSDYPEYEMLV